MKNYWPIKNPITNLLVGSIAAGILVNCTDQGRKTFFDDPRQALEQSVNNPRLNYSRLEDKIYEANVAHLDKNDTKSFELIQDVYRTLPDSLEYLYFDMTSTLADIYRKAGDQPNALVYGKKAIGDGNRVIDEVSQGKISLLPYETNYFVRSYINALDQYSLILKDAGDKQAAKTYFKAAREQERKLSRIH